MAGRLSPCFSFNTPPFHAVTFISCHSLPLQCGLMYTGPSVSRPLIYRASSVLLTCRLPGECIICESCPIQLESVSCWLPASTRWWTLGKQIWCVAVVTRPSRRIQWRGWNVEEWLCYFGFPLKAVSLNAAVSHRSICLVCQRFRFYSRHGGKQNETNMGKSRVAAFVQLVNL